ncbi:MAG: glyoxalase/bleomycin resistance/extradiol dioxygenase family protein [Gammaproteobacteria bacterium]|nr:glyoxalase/bleomycin resistance/extradiol dioxygenase family protein [Gammaproteobacteria bacterium]
MNPATITINIPVRELERAVHFYTQLGFEPHPVFRGPDCQCMMVTEHIRIMVHLDSSLQLFTPKPISDPSLTTGVVLCLDCNSKAQVDALVARAIAAGGSVYDAAQDLGFVYTHGFLDADGNAWRLNYMDPNVVMPE